ncbi:MAG: NADH:ubiquinone oxidoreductase [Coriobacteriia bacterium]|nr:NADH:ubiquinone oxidoreductase [Coriobacteriia bacterium]
MGARVVVLGLASDFGCQVQLTNIEDHLLDVLGLIDLSYWQLASSGHMPDEYDVALVEGAVTTDEHVELLRKVRETAAVVIAIGSCAVTGGIPALAGTGDLEGRYEAVYGEGTDVARGRTRPVAVTSVIEVDYIVPGCPIDTGEFLKVLSRVLGGLSDKPSEQPMCFACKTRENVCFFEKGEMCLGVVTRSGCHARCISLGRPCTGCRGIAPEANLGAARDVFEQHGFETARSLHAMNLYNTNEEVAL